MPPGEWLANVWALLVAVATLAGALVASAHAILYKRDTRATVLWVSFIWLAPVAGPICYLLLGINRIKRKAELLRKTAPRHGPLELQDSKDSPPDATSRPNLARRIRLVDRTTQLPLTGGNHVTPLYNGDEAYPEMLAAIDEAKTTVALGTYIFDRDPVGRRFAEALGGAVKRGVEVRVLVDATGARYSFPSIVHSLRRAGVRVARFLPTLAPFRTFALNMRNHRKILVADGQVGFTGGINIRAGNCTGARGEPGIRDVHFKVRGPVLSQMSYVFLDDWLFTTGERLEGPDWFPDIQREGEDYARVIADGPDETLDRLRWAILGALATAHDRVCIATPYFLPDASLISALNTAALRGVSVEILLPEKNNLPFVHWACMAHLWQVLERGCRVFFDPGKFAHSKFMTVDSDWTLLGSANWDPRSLRLNFEMDLECYSARLAGELNRHFDERLKVSREVTLAEVNDRSLPARMRDGTARLATPFL